MAENTSKSKAPAKQENKPGQNNNLVGAEKVKSVSGNDIENN